MASERTRGADEGQQVAAGEQPRRRGEDAPVLVFETGEGESRAGARLERFEATPEQLASAAFLIELGADRALLVPAADAHVLPRGAGGAELQARAAAAALALRRERDWIRRRLRMPDHLLAYAERLEQAATEADVYEALREVATPVVGAYTGVVYVGIVEAAGPEFHPLADPALRLPVEPLPADAARQLAEQRLVTLAEIEDQPGAAGEALRALLKGTAAGQLLGTPVGAEALLVLLERRRDRVLTGEDRTLLDALVRQAEVTLRRIVSERRVAAMALTDAVTGLPAGPHVDLMLQQALGRARRGHPLTLLLVDLEHATAEEPDEALHWLAASFSELRRTDLAVRREENRFLVLLADTDAGGAQRVAERIQDYVGSIGRVRTGIASFGPGQDTAEGLLAAAEGDLAGQDATAGQGVPGS